MKFNQKTIVITGSTRGIGFGLATEFLKLGHQVVINGTSEKSVNNALQQLSSYKDNLIGFAGNINQEYFPTELYNYTFEQFKKVDIWINNAGVSQAMNTVWDLELNEVQDNLNTNVIAPINAMRVIIPLMEKQGYGLILNMEGLGSDGRMVDKLAIYGTSKRAVNYLSKAVSKELKNSKVSVGIIAPGMVLTDFILKPMEQSSEKDKKATRFIFNLLGEKVETVSPILVNKVLKAKGNYPRIEYLTKGRIITKLMRSAFVKRDLFSEV